MDLTGSAVRAARIEEAFMEPTNGEKYPVHLKGELTEPLAPGLWLVKWLLAIPHYIILAFLFIGFAVATVIAFFAILFTGRYPRSLFDFNVGVLRWGWRVGFYSYEALGTDRYPPFTLEPVPDYPADLSIDYPERLSNWMVLVKWFLAIPHYAVLAPLAGWWWRGWGWRDRGAYDGGAPGFPFGGVLWLLVLFAAVVLLFTSRYPKDMYRLIMGINRWIYRVLGYVGLMTDRYPPFRLMNDE